MVFRICRRILGTTAEAEDAVQDTFERYMSSEFMHRCSVSTFLYAIATRVCIDRLRKIRRDDRLCREWSEAVRMSGDCATPRAENLLLVSQSLDNPELGPDMAQAALCYFVHGMTEQEISDALGINRRTVSYKIARFVQIAREHLEEEEGHG